MTWSQNYTPLGGVGASALVAALPVVTLLCLLAFWHVRAYLAALAGLGVALLIAVFVYGMPAPLAFMSSGYGAAFGFFPIGWIILNAIFIYNLSVETGGFSILQDQVAGISGDRRIQALLIAFSFGAFIEGAAGFGAPVAISGALLIGLGFRPLEAAKLALIGNTAPVAYGALGTPLITLAKVTDLDLGALSAMVGRQVPFFALLVPFWLIVAQVGWRGMVAVWPACLVTGLSFGVTQYLVSNHIGPMLVDIIASFVSMASLTLLMKFWRPADEAQSAPAPQPAPAGAGGRPPVWRAWLPWALLSVFVFIWGLPAAKAALNRLFSPSFNVPLLHLAVQKMPPLAPHPEPEAAVFAFNALSATGTALLLSGLTAGFCLTTESAKPHSIAISERFNLSPRM